MSNKPSWSKNDQGKPRIDAHTKAKHKVIETYIENFICTLYGKGRKGITDFTIVDGFCGGGDYLDSESGSWRGSPTRIIEAVRSGYERASRNYNLDIEYIFIDEQKNHIDYLKSISLPSHGLEKLACTGSEVTQIGDFGSLTESLTFYEQEFEKIAQDIILPSWNDKRFYFFLLDPCGWTDVTMNTIRQINSHKKSEILFTYMIDSIRRFGLTKQRDILDRTFEAQGYFSEKFKDYEVEHEQQYFRNEIIRLFRDKGKAKFVFTFALISDSISKLAQKPIKRDSNRVLYYLIHLSNHERAVEVMKESFSREKNLIYQYYFEVYGYAFRSSEFYQRDQLDLRLDNINVDDNDFCVGILAKQIVNSKLIDDKGILYGDLRRLTVEKNPSLKNHYELLICQLRDEGEIEILRKNKFGKYQITTARQKYKKDDIVQRRRKYQTNLFFKSKFGI